MKNNNKKIVKISVNNIFLFLWTVFVEYIPIYSVILFLMNLIAVSIIKSQIEYRIFKLYYLITNYILTPTLENRNVLINFIITVLFINTLYFILIQFKAKQQSFLLSTFVLDLRKICLTKLLNKDYMFFIENDKDKVIDQTDALYSSCYDFIYELITILDGFICVISTFILNSYLWYFNPDTQINTNIEHFRYLSRFVTIYTYFLIILMLFNMSYFIIKLCNLSMLKHKSSSSVDIFMTDEISNAQITYAFGSFKHEQKVFDKLLDKHFGIIKRFEKYKIQVYTIFESIFSSINLLDLMIIYYFLTYKLNSNLNTSIIIATINVFKFTIKNLIEIAIDCFRLNYSITYLLEIATELTLSLEFFDSSKSINNFCTKKCELNIKDYEDEDFELIVKNLDFFYQQDNIKVSVLNDINFVVSPGEKIGIVGLSGCGKTTLINNLLGLYKPTSGFIQLGPFEQNKLNQCCWSRMFSFIPQNSTLFNRTILENIILDNENVNLDEIKEICDLCYCNFIYENNKGFDFNIGVGGEKLSGGQKQRLAIARGMLRNKAKCVILDEATSALDARTEKYIINNLNKLTEDKIVIAIAHRISTLEKMDKILFLDRGKLIHFETPLELYKINDQFRNLCEEQNFSFA